MIQLSMTARVECLIVCPARQQTRVSTGQAPLGFWGTAAEMIRTEGPLRLYRGLSVALLRGIPGASVTFLTYTQVRQAIEPL